MRICYASQVALTGMFCFSGLIYEHQRPDRDDYVQIHSNNVVDQEQFNKFPYHPNSFGKYDATSIMHYRTFQGSSDGTKKTITSLVKTIKIKKSPFLSCQRTKIDPNLNVNQ